jgi:competence protein ComEA
MPAFDYAASDSEFAARSALADRPDSLGSDEDSVAATAGELHAAVSSKLSSVVHVNLNTAGRDELVGLPGIGPAMAGRIIAYRNLHGKFISVDDLSNVKGIGKKKLERLRPYCTVGK